MRSKRNLWKCNLNLQNLKKLNIGRQGFVPENDLDQNLKRESES